MATPLAAFIAANSVDSVDFTALNARFDDARDAGAEQWDAGDTCTAVCFAVGDFDILSLSKAQLLRISYQINSIWAPYPIHLTSPVTTPT